MSWEEHTSLQETDHTSLHDHGLTTPITTVGFLNPAPQPPSHAYESVLCALKKNYTLCTLKAQTNTIFPLLEFIMTSSSLESHVMLSQCTSLAFVIEVFGQRV